MQQTDLAVLLVAVAVFLVVALIVIVSRRRSRRPVARLAAGSRELLNNILVPDGEGGQIQIEYALLCARGIVVLNLKEVDGNVFGSDSMQEWAVISDKARFGFRNPQDGLYDRVAAVRRLLPDVPVHGYIAFTGKAQFTKGVPSHVVLFDELVTELQQEHARQTAVDAYFPAWETLKASAQSA